MLCKNCGEDNAIGRTRCLICAEMLVNEDNGSPANKEVATQEPRKTSTLTEKIGSWAGLAVTVIAFQAIAPHMFDHTNGFNYLELLCACITGALGGAIGHNLGSRFNSGQ